MGKDTVNPKRPQFSLKLYHPLFYMNPNGPSQGLSFPTSCLRARGSLAFHLREGSIEEEGGEIRVMRKTISYFSTLLCANICFNLYRHTHL